MFTLPVSVKIVEDSFSGLTAEFKLVLVKAYGGTVNPFLSEVDVNSSRRPLKAKVTNGKWIRHMEVNKSENTAITIPRYG